MFHHNFYPKPKLDLKDADISKETRQKVLILQHNYDDIVSKHSSDIRLTHLEEMKIDTNPNVPPVASKPYPLPLKHHKFMKEEIKKFIRSRTNRKINESLCITHYRSPRKSKPVAPLAKTKRLVIDYHGLYKQIPKVQTTQAKSKDS